MIISAFNTNNSSSNNSTSNTVTSYVTSGKLFNFSACFLICEMGIIIVSTLYSRLNEIMHVKHIA